MYLEEIIDYIEKSRDRFVGDLRRLLRQSSVSAQNEGMEECAESLKDIMQKSAVDAKVIPIEGGHPLVLGEVESQTSKRTLLIYSHYDVQPPEPYEEWEHAPFSADIVDGKIVARGAADAKNNIIISLKAVETLSEISGDVPVNLKFLFEGEEEIESPNLESFVENNKETLEANAVLCLDGEMDPTGRPAIRLGVKGMLYVELSCRGAKSDVHSAYAPIVENPVWRMVEALGTLRTPDGKVAIQGWYDRVRPPSPEEMRLIDEIPFDEEGMKRRFGIINFLHDLHGLEALKALLHQPTCTICGIQAGYGGPGLKTALPNKAMVKLDFRLVSNQNPSELLRRLKNHLKRKGYGDIEVKVVGASESSKTSVRAEIAQAAKKAAEKIYKLSPVVYPNAYGSAPDYLFTKRLGLDSIWMGFSPPFSKIHAPNEFTTIDSFMKGIACTAAIMSEFGSI